MLIMAIVVKIIYTIFGNQIRREVSVLFAKIKETKDVL